MAQAPQQSGQDSGYGPIWYTLLFCITMYVLWMKFHTQIVSLMFYLSYWQMKMFAFFVPNDNINQIMFILQTLDPQSVDWRKFIDLLTLVGNYTRYVLAIIFLVFAFIAFSKNLKSKFSKAHDMRSLRNKEQFNWTAIMPVVNLDLASIDINTGPWAMGLTPMEFARKHNLLKKDDAILNVQTPGMEYTAGLRNLDAKRVFTLQLGSYFNDFMQLPKHTMLLAAVFMARLNRDRDSAAHILDSINRSWSQGSPDYSVAIPTLKKYMNSDAVRKIVSHHAYVLTMMAALLEAARIDGVIPSAEFIWLKPTDRRLWYMLNSIGRQTPYAEVGGPFAHLKAEKLLGRASMVPMIDEAIKALEIAIKEIKLTPKELEELPH